MELSHIDHGEPFDWSRTSQDYARYRDIYPPDFYRHLLDRGLCTQGQRVLDLGTGTGVLPRALCRYGARFTGVDPAPGQIQQARALAARDGLDIDFRCAAAEDCAFPDGSFDVVTACQCFTYFDHARLAPLLHRLLKPGGAFAVLYMSWLPEEDPVARQSEGLILRYNPAWTGGGEVRAPIVPPADYDPFTAAGLKPSDVLFTTGVTAGQYLPYVQGLIDGLEADCAAAGMEFNWFHTVDGVEFLDYVKDTALSHFGVSAKDGTEAYKNFDVQVYYSRYLDLKGV